MISKTTFGALAGAALVLALAGGSAQAAAPKPTPVPYTLGYEVVTDTTTGLADMSAGAQSQTFTAEADCPSGKRPTGGGYERIQSGGQHGLIFENRPTDTGWSVTWGGQNTDQPITATIYAVCVNAS